MADYGQIIKDIQQRKFSPVYLLTGDEPYYIDTITEMLCAKVVPDDEKDFNQHILYGAETDAVSVINLCRSFPMMSDFQLVVVKEAQQLSRIEDLEIYLRNPLPSTVLVLNYKNGVLDKRKKLYSAIDKIGVVYESKKVPDYKLPAFIVSFVQSKNILIDQKSAQLLSDYLGNDLNKIDKEIEKLSIVLPPGAVRKITPELIETHIGISKDYNNFELLKAIIEKNAFKAMQIADYFEKNPKNNPMVVTMSVLFNFFSNLMICYWAKDKTEQGIAAELGFRNTFQARDYVAAIKNYNAFKSMEIVSLLRTYDAKNKGIDRGDASDGELLKELLYKIIH